MSDEAANRLRAHVFFDDSHLMPVRRADVAALLDEREQLRAALHALAEWGPLAESLDVVEFRRDVVNALEVLGKVT